MITIVIPTYNEKENIARFVNEIYKNVSPKDFKIIIVDDNSPDGTGKIGDELARKHESVSILHRYDKRGVGSAIMDGIRASTTEIVGVMDADFSHPPSVLPRVKEALKNHDFVIPTRFMKGGGVEGWSLKRKLVSRIGKSLSLPVTRIRDPMSGFFFIRKDAIPKQIDETSCKICLELAVKGNYKNRIEIPYIFPDRKAGTSKMGMQMYKEYIKHIGHLLKYRLKKMLNKNKSE